MKHVFLCLFIATLCVTAHAQTIKSLGYNTNFVVVYGATNALRFTNAPDFDNGATFAGGDLQIDSVGVINWGGVAKYEPESQYFFGAVQFEDAAGTRTNLGLGATWLTNNNVTNFRAAIGLGETNDASFNSVAVTNDAQTRTNLGLPLAALTNDSNVTMMRALAGQTNTNTPASGTYQITNIVSLIISNGIIVEVEVP